MKRFIQGEDRAQGILLPELLDDYVAADKPVRVIEVFVDELDLGKLGFQGIDPKRTLVPTDSSFFCASTHYRAAGPHDVENWYDASGPPEGTPNRRKRSDSCLNATK